MIAPRDIWLSRWAACAGAGLFAPAVKVPGLMLPLQIMDVLVLFGLPFIATLWSRLSKVIGGIALLGLASALLAFFVADGQGLILAHAFLFATPFVLLAALVACSVPARTAFVGALLWAAAISCLLFLSQILIGAEILDFRTNTAFSLPAQYGRGFALFPEVSTYATHTIIALCIALSLRLHPDTPLRYRRLALLVIPLCIVTLMLSRSTSFLIVAPILCTIALASARPLSPVRCAQIFALMVLGAVVLAVFFVQFYADRLETAAASRSAAMRLSSILAGLSPLWTGEVFGVGLGENHEIQRRAFDVARAFDLNFGQIPSGVNSQIIARIFEEGWPALVQFAMASTVLLRVLIRHQSDPFKAALVILASGSFLTALMVTGYRGIYTNWLWLALPAGIIASQTPLRFKTTPTVLNKITRSSRSPAREA